MSQNKIEQIPKQFFMLFWDYDPESMDVVRHKELIIGRIAELGSWESMKWLLKTYSKDEILSFLNHKGKQALPFRELNYWLLMMGVPAEKREQILSEASESNHVWKNRNPH